MGRRTVLLIASILVAAVGTALIFMYVRGADNRANAGARGVLVVVASKDIPRGAAVRDLATSFTSETIKRNSLPTADGSFYTYPDGLKTLQARSDATAFQAIPAGAYIRTSDFIDANQASTTGLASGQVEMSIQIGDADRVPGVIKPGLKVAVMLTPDGATAASRYLLDKAGINVLRVGSTGPDAGNGETVSANIITLAVTPLQALELRGAENSGTLSLVILGADANSAATS